MRRDWKSACTLVLPCLLVLGACAADDDDDHGNPPHDAMSGLSAAKCTPEQLEFMSGPAGIGMVTMGEKMLAQIRTLDASPRQPKRFENDWTVGFLNAAGQPLNDVQIVSVCAYMPEHRHFEPPQQITPMSDPSSFKFSKLNLSMAGAWLVQVAINSPTIGGTPSMATRCDPAMGSEMIVLHACIPDE